MIEHNYKKLRTAQELNKRTLEAVAMRLMKKDDCGIFQLPDDNEVFAYINKLAEEGKVKHYVLKGENEDVFLFDNEDLIGSVSIVEVQARKFTEVAKIQCYDEPVSFSDNVPIEISKIENLFKIPRSTFNSGTAIYFLCRNEKVVYVGQAENVHGRILDHAGTKNFDSVFYIRVQSNKMNKIESALISYLKPEYNRTSLNGNNKSESLAKSVLNEHHLIDLE